MNSSERISRLEEIDRELQRKALSKKRDELWYILFSVILAFGGALIIGETYRWLSQLFFGPGFSSAILNNSQLTTAWTALIAVSLVIVTLISNNINSEISTQELRSTVLNLTTKDSWVPHDTYYYQAYTHFIERIHQLKALWGYLVGVATFMEAILILSLFSILVLQLQGVQVLSDPMKVLLRSFILTGPVALLGLVFRFLIYRGIKNLGHLGTRSSQQSPPLEGHGKEESKSSPNEARETSTLTITSIAVASSLILLQLKATNPNFLGLGLAIAIAGLAYRELTIHMYPADGPGKLHGFTRVARLLRSSFVRTFQVVPVVAWSELSTASVVLSLIAVILFTLLEEFRYLRVRT